MDDKKKKWIKELLSWGIVLLAAFILGKVITKFVIVKVEVPTPSMETTIMVGDHLVANRLAYLFTEPKRGDIVVFKFPDDETQDYIKRIIGLPGETVEIKDGLVYINGGDNPLEEEYLKEPMKGSFGPYEVPEDCYFMMGDNRNNSTDARFWENTYVKRSKILAKALFRYRPDFKWLN